MSKTKDPTFLTIGQVAEQWQVGTRSVRRWIAQGDLPAYRVGGLVRIKRDDMANFTKRVLAAGGDRA